MSLDFRTIKPRTRDERHAVASREQVEKERLQNRREGFHTGYDDVGAQMRPHEGNPGYLR